MSQAVFVRVTLPGGHDSVVHGTMAHILAELLPLIDRVNTAEIGHILINWGGGGVSIECAELRRTKLHAG